MVLGILACLQSPDGKIAQSSEDSTAVRELAVLIARVISPVEDDVGKGEEDEDVDISLGMLNSHVSLSFHLYFDVLDSITPQIPCSFLTILLYIL